MNATPHGNRIGKWVRSSNVVRIEPRLQEAVDVELVGIVRFLRSRLKCARIYRVSAGMNATHDAWQAVRPDAGVRGTDAR
jgi:hypothetical protein